MNFEDGFGLFAVNEHPDGRRWHTDAHWDGDPIDGADASYVLEFKPGTRHASWAEVRLGPRVVSLECGLQFSMQGLGYTHPTWGHGMYVGDDVRTYEALALADVDETAPFQQHVQTVCRCVGDDVRTYEALALADVDETAPFQQHVQTVCRCVRDDGAVGIGVLEQLIIGPHAPSGLHDLLDMHP
jgi:hypothetical protein